MHRAHEEKVWASNFCTPSIDDLVKSDNSVGLGTEAGCDCWKLTVELDALKAEAAIIGKAYGGSKTFIENVQTTEGI